MQQAIPGETYDFAAKPAVRGPKAKYREQYYEEDDQMKGNFQNLMFDKRVIRGNTYANIVRPMDNFKETHKLTRSIKKPIKQQRQEEIDNNQMEPGTPEPVEGRHHAALQTDEFVETLTDKPPNYEKDTQTDFYIDRPLNRLFMPKKDGEDKETQIWDGELFDFDYEVEPILQVLIGKTLEQSRMEVLEEEELRVMKDQQKRFEQLRNAELAEMQKLEAKERRLLQENENRKAQYKAKLQQDILSHKKMISRVMAKKFLNNLQPTVLNVLKDQGVFRNPLDITLMNNFLPWLYDEVGAQLQNSNQTQNTISNLLANGFEQNQNQHKEALEKERQRRAEILEQRRLQAEEEERQRQKRREERRRRKEEERRQKLKEQILEQLVSKGESRPNILGLNIADIDNHQADAPAVGLFGGLIGETILFLTSLGQISEGDEKYAGVKEWVNSTENIVNVFKELVTLITQEGNLEVQVNEDVDNQLQALLGVEPEEGEEAIQQNMTNWHLAPEEKINEVYELIRNNISHLSLNTIKQKQEDLGIPADAIDECIMALLKLIYNQDEIKDKVKWIKVQPKETYNQAGICYMKPDLKTLQINSRSDRYDEQPEPTNEDEQPQPLVPVNLVEADYENKQTLFVQQNEELNVLTQHAVAEQIIREEILKQVGSQLSQVAGQEYAIQMEALERMRNMQTVILDHLVPEYPVLDMDTY